MEKCKYCQAELEEGSTICPVCGKENAAPEVVALEAETVSAEEENVEVPETLIESENAVVPETSAQVENAVIPETPGLQEPVVEGQPSEIQEGVKATPGKIALAAAAVVVLLAVLAALIVNGLSSASAPEESQPTQDAAETIEATIPPDGNPDDVTCKGTYTASDEEVIAAGDTVVATAGDLQLTNSQLQVYYWREVHSFLSSYGAYAAYFGLDYTQPLDTQVCSLTGSGTWQQYFLACALSGWQTYQSMAAESVAVGHELSAEFQGYLDTLEADLEADAAASGFADAKALLAYNIGAGAEIADYLDFMEAYYRGYDYYAEIREGIEPTDEELEDYFAQHEAEYAENGITKDALSVDVRHILVFPEGAASDTIYTETFPDEAWAVAEANAQAILDEWLGGEKTEESFAALANEKSADPGSNTNGGLYTEVTVGQMVAPFEEWCFDESRQVGDYGIVKTDLGYHIMYFSASRPIWIANAKSDFINEKANSVVDEAIEKYPMTVDYRSILLGFVDLAA